MQAVTSAKQAGNAAFVAGDYAAAADHYSEAIRLCDGMQRPEGIHLLYGNRAAAALKLERWAAALQDSEAALAADPRWVKALYRKAAALQGLGQSAAAAAAAQQALLLEPGNKGVQQLLQQLGAAAAVTASTAAAAADGKGVEVTAAPSGSSTRKPAPTAALLPPLLAAAPWEYVPAADGVDENLLLLLHGLGDRPAAFARLARQMALPQTAALALGGPQTVPFSDGGRSWYTVFTEEFDMIEGRPGEQRRQRSLQHAVAALQQLLVALRQCGWQQHRVHLLGFSQGGTVALELARQQQASRQPLGSCVALSAALLPEQVAQEQQQRQQQQEQQRQREGAPHPSSSGGPSGTPVLITHGSADKVLSRWSVEHTAEVLRSVHGMPASVHSVAKAHTMPQGPAEMRQLMQFWAQHLSRRPTAADLPPEVAAAGSSSDGQLLEVRPGEVSIQLVGEQQ